MNLRDIAIKLAKGELPPISSKELSTERLKMCKNCEYFAKALHQCKLCGCQMDLKTKLLEASCPIDKW